MNLEDFDKRLQQQPIRPVPEHWRNQILQRARQIDSRQPKAENSPAKSWLHQLLWPCPQAWGALAAVWVVVLFLNSNSHSPNASVVKVPTESREVMMAVKHQLIYRTELMTANDVPVAEPPKFSAPQSRNEPAVRFVAV
jgi:hypothetical protein